MQRLDIYMQYNSGVQTMLACYQTHVCAQCCRAAPPGVVEQQVGFARITQNVGHVVYYGGLALQQCWPRATVDFLQVVDATGSEAQH